MRVLITGGLGFQGAHLAEYWARAGHRVTVLNTPTPRAVQMAGALDPTVRVDIVWGSVTDAEVVSKVVRGHDVVAHLAAWASVDASLNAPLSSLTVNAVGTLHVLEAVRATGARLLHASSCEVYGPPEAPFPQHEQSPLNPMSPYAASKAAADRLAYAYHHTYGVPVTIVRPCNVYGPRQRAGADGAVIPIFLAAARAGARLQVRGDGRQAREYLHVDDLLLGYDLVLHRGRPGEAYNLGSGTVVPIWELALKIADAHRVGIDFVPARPGEVPTFLLDSSKAARELGWTPTVDFWKGLTALCES